jgi:hypothetical protein
VTRAALAAVVASAVVGDCLDDLVPGTLNAIIQAGGGV